MCRSFSWSKLGKDKPRTRQSRHQRIAQYEDAEYSLLQEGNNEGDYPLQSRNSDVLFEKELEPGDTLQTLSLQFNCPIAELKRINHILRDNEIFARRVIQIPVKPGSVISERLAGVHTSGAGNKEEEGLLVNFDDTHSKQPSTEDGYFISSLCSASATVFKDKPVNLQESVAPFTDVLNQNTISEPLVNRENFTKASSIINRLGSFQLVDVAGGDDSTEASLSGPLLCQENPQLEDSAHAFTCNGADWGFTWPQVVVFSLLLGFAGPILYVLYITEREHPD